METRCTYGWGGSGITDAETLKKWIVGYRCKSGAYGEIGYRTFQTKEEAELFAMELMREKSYITQTIIKHPAKTYSTY